MKHPTIIKFYGFSLTDFDDLDNVTLILQLAKNVSLEQLITNARRKSTCTIFNNTTRQKILIGIARGMMYLHQHHVIHRDLKPANILLDANHEPLLTDFGSSKIVSNEINDNTEYVGTVLYMAPEVINSTDYNGKADVFSFGILMYSVVTTASPYSELFRTKIKKNDFIKKVCNDKYRPKFNTKIKPSIQQYIEDCWSDNPDERPTFETIFNRLAYNTDESIYNIFGTMDDNDDSYYLVGIDINEVLSYADKVNSDTINNCEDEITQMRQRIVFLENENHEMKQRIVTLEEENENIMKQMNELNPIKKKKSLSSSSSKSIFTSSQNIVKKGNRIEVNFVDNNDFSGILNYIITESRDYMTEIEITSSSVPRDSKRFSPLNAIKFNENTSQFMTREESNSWIRIGFIKHHVIPKMYTIRSSNSGENASHPKTWSIEGSLGSIDWDILDQQMDCKFLNGRNLTHTFTIENPTDEKYKYLRMRLTDCNWYNRHQLCFSCIEFYGTII